MQAVYEVLNVAAVTAQSIDREGEPTGQSATAYVSSCSACVARLLCMFSFFFFVETRVEKFGFGYGTSQKMIRVRVYLDTRTRIFF